MFHNRKGFVLLLQILWPVRFVGIEPTTLSNEHQDDTTMPVVSIKYLCKSLILFT